MRLCLCWSNAGGAYLIVLSLCRREEAKNVAELAGRQNSRRYFFAATHCARIHPSPLPFNCHVVSYLIHSLMPIDHHPEDNWLQWFEIRSPYFPQLQRQVFNGELRCKIHVVDGLTSLPSADPFEQIASWVWGWQNWRSRMGQYVQQWPLVVTLENPQRKDAATK